MRNPHLFACFHRRVQATQWLVNYNSAEMSSMILSLTGNTKKIQTRNTSKRYLVRNKEKLNIYCLAHVTPVANTTSLRKRSKCLEQTAFSITNYVQV
jgi:hypothetical protein